MLQMTDYVSGLSVWIAAWQVVRVQMSGDATEVHTVGGQYSVVRGEAKEIARQLDRCMRMRVIHQTPDYRE